ncbi:hypothetical protein SLITO_v1c02380 [Spiroplasma litorale]|uniref:Uncharacterized protein n=1 Tax=Spiroplasma litorale TaxID=216942 RepID=A0A0K1W0Q0_9MOLU|nr:hypothetical protein SLITO_v1c02380 [Spiroplasma litorale]
MILNVSTNKYLRKKLIFIFFVFIRFLIFNNYFFLFFNIFMSYLINSNFFS